MVSGFNLKFNSEFNRTALVEFDDPFDGHRFGEQTPQYTSPPADRDKVKKVVQRYKSNFWSFSPIEAKSNAAGSCDPDIAKCQDIDTNHYDAEIAGQVGNGVSASRSEILGLLVQRGFPSEESWVYGYQRRN